MAIWDINANYSPIAIIYELILNLTYYLSSNLLPFNLKPTYNLTYYLN
jgi:hypothetical protein